MASPISETLLDRLNATDDIDARLGDQLRNRGAQPGTLSAGPGSDSTLILSGRSYYFTDLEVTGTLFVTANDPDSHVLIYVQNALRFTEGARISSDVALTIRAGQCSGPAFVIATHSDFGPEGAPHATPAADGRDGAENGRNGHNGADAQDVPQANAGRGGHGGDGDHGAPGGDGRAGRTGGRGQDNRALTLIAGHFAPDARVEMDSLGGPGQGGRGQDGGNGGSGRSGGKGGKGGDASITPPGARRQWRAGRRCRARRRRRARRHRGRWRRWRRAELPLPRHHGLSAPSPSRPMAACPGRGDPGQPGRAGRPGPAAAWAWGRQLAHPQPGRQRRPGADGQPARAGQPGLPGAIGARWGNPGTRIYDYLPPQLAWRHLLPFLDPETLETLLFAEPRP
ncbi:MAG: hypothetical protein R3D78_07130 [Paracoccaceae bacterium]